MTKGDKGIAEKRLGDNLKGGGRGLIVPTIDLKP